MALGMILAAYQVGSQLYGAYETGQEADEQAELQREAMREQVRRMDLSFTQTAGSARSKLGASGIEMTSASSQQVLSDMSAEYQREREYTISMAQKQIAQTERTGEMAMLAGFGGAAQSGISAYNSYESPTKSDGVNSDVGTVKNKANGSFGSFAYKSKAETYSGTGNTTTHTGEWWK